MTALLNMEGVTSYFVNYRIFLRLNAADFYFKVGSVDPGRVVRKPVKVNPGLNVNCSILFSYLKVFFTSNVWCSLRLLQLKTEGQTM